MKYDRLNCTCGGRMSVPNYMGGNGTKEMWWCRNCGRIRFKDWNGAWKSIKPKQSANIDMLRRMYNWAEQVYQQHTPATSQRDINQKTLNDVRAYLKKQGDLV